MTAGKNLYKQFRMCYHEFVSKVSYFLQTLVLTLCVFELYAKHFFEHIVFRTFIAKF